MERQIDAVGRGHTLGQLSVRSGGGLQEINEERQQGRERSLEDEDDEDDDEDEKRKKEVQEE